VDFNTLFPHRAFISLERRGDRRERMQSRMAAAGITAEWFRAVDAKTLRDPCGYKGVAQRANSLSFRLLIRTAELRASPALLILEDDAVFHPQFAERVARLELPDDWQILYFGCLHLEPPKRVNEGIVRVARALDTHMVAIRQSAFRTVRKIMHVRAGRGAGNFFNDVLLADLHKVLPTYAAFPNLAWQEVGQSDIAGRRYSNYDAHGAQIPCEEMVRHLKL
jgi:hypothetical protein